MEPKKQKDKIEINEDGNVVSRKVKRVKVICFKDKKSKQIRDIKHKYFSLKDKKIKFSKVEVKQMLKVSSVKGKKILTVKNGKASKKKVSALAVEVHASNNDKLEMRNNDDVNYEESYVREKAESSSGLMNNVDGAWLGCTLRESPIADDSLSWESHTLAKNHYDEKVATSEDGTVATMKQTSEKNIRFADSCTNSDHNSTEVISSSIDMKTLEFERPLQLSKATSASYSLDVQAEALHCMEGEIKCRPEEENSDKENLPNANSLAKIKENGLLGSQRRITSSIEEAGTSSINVSDLTGVNTRESTSRKRQLEATVDIMPVPLEKRPRRSIGRASELASQRKAMMDY